MTETNAERLERIAKTWQMTKEVENIHPTFIADMQFLFEQAERAQRLYDIGNGVVDAHHFIVQKIDSENERLREALEFYAKDINHSRIGSHSEVSYDKGRIARQALEESK